MTIKQESKIALVHTCFKTHTSLSMQPFDLHCFDFCFAVVKPFLNPVEPGVDPLPFIPVSNRGSTVKTPMGVLNPLDMMRAINGGASEKHPSWQVGYLWWRETRGEVGWGAVFETPSSEEFELKTTCKISSEDEMRQLMNLPTLSLRAAYDEMFFLLKTVPLIQGGVFPGLIWILRLR